MLFHVDDLLIGGDDSCGTVLNRFQEKYFLLIPLKHVSSEFLGKRLKKHDDHTTSVQQQEYAKAMKSILISKERRKQIDRETTDQENGQMRGVLGELNWLVSGSRPDLAASCSLLKQKVVSSKVEDLVQVNNVVSMVTDFSGLEIRIKPINPTELQFVTWSDASFANCREKEPRGIHSVCHTMLSSSRKVGIDQPIELT